MRKVRRAALGLTLVVGAAFNTHCTVRPKIEWENQEMAIAEGRILVDARFEGESISLDAVMSDLAQVPSYVVAVGNRRSRVVVFSGEVTDQPEAAHLKGQYHLTAGLYDKVSGLYLRDERMAFIHLTHNGGSPSTPLHEYGHLIDHALDYPSEDADFVGLWEVSRRKTFLRMQIMREHAARDSGEFFADCFSAYYLSQTSEWALKRDFEEAHKYMEKFDEEMSDR